MTTIFILIAHDFAHDWFMLDQIVDDFRVLFEQIYKSLTANLSCQTPTKYVLTHKSHCKWDIWMHGLDVAF
jgi:hypothetical protein